MARITLDGIAHAYGGKPRSEQDYALKPLHHVWEQGMAYALLGPSGCGKTTLLNIISGLVIPSEGRLLFDDIDVTRLPTKERNIAQVFQFPVIYDTMTVAENLAFPLKNRRLARAAIDRRVTEIAAMLDLTGVLNRRARGLTADAKQKISLGSRFGSLGCVGRLVRRAPDGDRSGAQVGAEVEAEGCSSSARSLDDLCDARSDRGADLRR